jgi:ubiquitin carboxyl-terminal hydrolase 5/13
MDTDNTKPAATDDKDKKEKEKKEEEQEPPVPFDKCLAEWAASQTLTDYNCPVCKTRTKAIKYNRFESYPDTLMVAMRRFVHDNWVPTKLNMDVVVDKEINLEQYRGKGLQKGEQEMPKPAGATPQANEAIVQQLTSMGFGKNRCIRACLATGNRDAEAAMQWLMEKMDDATLDLPLEAPKSAEADLPPADLISQLEGMGFPKDRCIYALRQTKHDAQRAIDWLFSHMDEDLPASGSEGKQQDNKSQDSKPARYRLCAFITHLGRSTGTGHYVAHILREGRWVLFNDQKVSVSSTTPSGQAYIYFFRRY